MNAVDGSKFLCEMPPGDGPWRLRSFHGQVYAHSAAAGLFHLEILVEPNGLGAQWVQIVPEANFLAVHTWDAPLTQS